jgi:hypothetical protein
MPDMTQMKSFNNAPQGLWKIILIVLIIVLTPGGSCDPPSYYEDAANNAESAKNDADDAAEAANRAKGTCSIAEAENAATEAENAATEAESSAEEAEEAAAEAEIYTGHHNALPIETRAEADAARASATAARASATAARNAANKLKADGGCHTLVRDTVKYCTFNPLQEPATTSPPLGPGINFDDLIIDGQGGDDGLFIFTPPPQPLLSTGGRDILDSPPGGGEDILFGGDHGLDDYWTFDTETEFNSSNTSRETDIFIHALDAGGDDGTLTVDILAGEGNDTLRGEMGDDRLFGEPGAGNANGFDASFPELDPGHDMDPNMGGFGDAADTFFPKNDVPPTLYPAEKKWYGSIMEILSPIPAAMAAKKPASRKKHISLRAPTTKGYIVKIRINRKEKGWRNPARYLTPSLAMFVARSWTVDDIMYVSIHIPQYDKRARGSK